MYKFVKLRKIANITTGFPFKGEMYSSNGIRVLRGENVTIGSLRWDSIKCWGHEFGQVDKYSLKNGDVVIGMDGSRVGKNRARIKQTDLPLLLAQRVACLRSTELSNQDFLYYLIRDDRFEQYVNRIQTGSSIPHISQEQIGDFTVSQPPLDAQIRIAKTLMCLDAKIELNQRINAELESMAKTLYDYWFVQNKNVGKLKVGKLGDFIEVNAQSITKNYPHSEIEYIDIASVSTGRLEGTTKYEIKDAPSRARRLVKHGDTIWSTVRPNRKSYLFICNPKENIVASTGFAVLTPKKIPPSFLYFFTTTDQFVNYLISNAEGSAYPAVSADRFAEIDFAIPPESKLAEFENIVSPILTKISQNERESQTLTELRDWLLPMLMNGQVTIK